MSIPKVIHYVWVGGKELPPLAKKCIASWKTYLPDYEIKEWNERSFDICSNAYCREAYEAKKYAFVSDYIRIFVLFHYGGIYMDTDVEVLKPLADEFLECEAFSGFETPKTIPTGIMGSVPGQEMFREILEFYENNHFLNSDGSINTVTNVKTITDIAAQHGFLPNDQIQTVLGMTLYSKTYFCPLSHDDAFTDFSDKTYTIHHFSGSWCDRKTRFVGSWNRGMRAKTERYMGKRAAGVLYRVGYNVCRALDFLSHQ